MKDLPQSYATDEPMPESSLDDKPLATAVFAFRTPNLGDDVQSLAASTHLPFVDRLVNRDSLFSEHLSRRHLVIFNSWFLLGDKYETPSSSIEPVFFGFCLGRPALLESPWLDYLRQNQPIGCRDMATVQMLERVGIQASFTGCITMFYGRYFSPIPESQRRGIVVIDVDSETEKRLVPEDLRKRADRYSNFVPPSIRQDRILRMGAAGRLFDRLRTAELVITRRLHAALPCVGFQTPVVVLPDPAISNARNRFSGYERFLPMLFQGDNERKQGIDWTRRTPVVVPRELEDSYQQFLLSLNSRTGSEMKFHGSDFSSSHNTTVTTANPGLGSKPGQASLCLGDDLTTCQILSWSDREIQLILPAYPRIGGFRFKLRLDAYDGEARRMVDLQATALASHDSPYLR